MREFHLGPIDKRLAHKEREENVFVRDLRRAVPALLNRELVESRILPQLSPDDQEKFLRSYLLITATDGSQSYTLSLVPFRMPSRLLSFEEGLSPFSDSEKRTLARYYQPDETGEWHHRHNNVSEMEDVVLTHLLEGKKLGLVTEDLVGLANLFESVPGLPREPAYHAGLHIDVTHSFFFEHHNEHVPGMMVLEAARQFALACWHRFGQVPVHGYQFILNQLNSQFFDYVDLNYPAELKAEVKDLSQRPSGEWETATVVVTVTQGDSVCAEVSLPAQIVSKRSFQRLRAGRTKTNPQHRFQPIATIHHKISLWNTETQKYHDARLVDLSLEGLGAEVPETFDDQSNPSSWELFLYFEDVGFIRVRSALVWRRPGKGVFQLGFRFTEVSPSDRAQLHTVIRQYCHVHRGRERL